MRVVYPGEEKYADIGGGSVCYLDEGEGRPLLFLHGLGGSITNFTPNIEYFKEKYRVIALDLPGYGKSEYVESDYSPEFFTGVITRLLHIRGVDRVTVIGNSLGGLITLHLVLHHPEVVDAVVLVDSAGGSWNPSLLKRVVYGLPPRLLKKAIVFAFMRLVRFRVFHPLLGIYHITRHTKALLDEAVDCPNRPDIENYLEAYVRTSRTAVSTSYEDRLGEIDKPTLIVWGQKDLGIPLKVGQAFNRTIEGSFLVALPRAAHVPQLDQPELFNIAVERFLEGVAARS